MKIALVSDIHGNLAALRAVLEEIDAQAVDAVLDLGDILSGPLQPVETADLLIARGFPTISGNHERQLLSIRDKGKRMDPLTSDGCTAAQLKPAHWEWLRSLPAEMRVDDVLLTHGTPASDLAYLMETATPDFGVNGSNGVRPATDPEVRERLGASIADARVVVCGHTHVPRVMTCDGVLVVNPGSVGVQAFEWDRPHMHHVETGSPLARYATIERRGGRWSACLHAVAYDHESQAEVAQRRGFKAWAHALRTGRMPPAIEPGDGD